MRFGLSYLPVFIGLLAMLATAAAFSATAQTGSRIKGSRSSAPVNVQHFAAPSEIDQVKRLIARDRAEEAVTVALELLERELEPGTRYYALNALCVAQSQTEAYDAALESCNKAVKLRGSHWMALNSRGSVYLWLNRPGRALEDFRSALGLVRNDSDESGIIRRNIQIAQSWLARGSS